MPRAACSSAIDTTEDPHREETNVQKIFTLVASLFGVEVDDLLSRNRAQPIRLSRQVATYLFRERLAMSLPEIGSLLKQDHATVLHSCQKIGRAIRTDRWIRRTVKKITEELA